MSLVLEALRRVEKPGAAARSVGASIASYRPARRRGGTVFPLLLGLGAGGIATAFFGPPANRPSSPATPASSGAVSEADRAARTPKGRAGLPPPIFESRVGPPVARQATAPVSFTPRPAAPAMASAPALVLQGISERDSQPIAIINDQLVREGDRLGTARVLSIGSDSVEVVLENGKRETVHFAPPPESSPTPDPL